MASINEKFMEEYKRLDKLCREAYNTEKGITTYIDAMKAVPADKSRIVHGWNTDLSRLIALRHVRNQFAHDVGTVATALCNDEDIEWLRNFYSRMTEARDPLALLEKSTAKKAKPAAKAESEPDADGVAAENDEPRGCLAAIILGFLCAALIIAAVIISTR